MVSREGEMARANAVADDDDIVLVEMVADCGWGLGRSVVRSQ